jgi:hypothetical protein
MIAITFIAGCQYTSFRRGNASARSFGFVVQKLSQVKQFFRKKGVVQEFADQIAISGGVSATAWRRVFGL